MGRKAKRRFQIIPGWPKGLKPKDFLGNEFLLWLWFHADAKGGTVPSQTDAQATAFFVAGIDLDCAYGQTGKDLLRGDGPSTMPEARQALRTGKLPRKAGLIIDCNKQQFAMAIAGDSFSITGLKLPDVEEADSPRVLFEERVNLLRDFCKTMDAIYSAFLMVRASSSWEGMTAEIDRWLSKAKSE